MPNCIENFAEKVEHGIASFFGAIGRFVGSKPRQTILYSILLTIVCGAGFIRWETENRGEKLWVPQGTTAQDETDRFQTYYTSSSRFNNFIVQSSNNGNVLTKETLLKIMQIHEQIENGEASVTEEADLPAAALQGVGQDDTYTFTDLCTKSGGSCSSSTFTTTTTTGNNSTSNKDICQCLVTSVLRQWNYDLATLQADDNYMQTLNNYGTPDDLDAVLGNPVFDDNGQLVSAEAVVISYFLQDREVDLNGELQDPVNAAWEEQVFLSTAESVNNNATLALDIDYFAGRSFQDEFGSAISGDLSLVQVSYIAAFLFLGANLGRIRCGTGSRWTMALAALVTVGLATGAGFGLSSACGLFFGPVHSLLPFILLGIGVDDVFVIVNAYNRERNVPRASESNQDITDRSSRALARAGASITVTSATDLVAFAISSSSGLPALASFCAYAAICIFFLWVFASTFFSACLVLDERRQRDNRRECLCCVTRKKEMVEDDGEQDGFQEDFVSRYFRKYHGPAILSTIGKAVVLLLFAGLIAFGFYGAINLSVEDSQRSFIPEGYVTDYFDATDEYFPSTGIDVYMVFLNQDEIYEHRDELARLDERLTGLSDEPPYIAEPTSEETYRNVMTGLYKYLSENGSDGIGGVALGEDNWPTSAQDLGTTLQNYASFSGPGAMYSRDIDVSEDSNDVQAIRVKLEYVRLIKESRSGETIDDANRQIEAMDTTRSLLDSWDDLPPAFPYSDKFIEIEGFKVIKRELFQNVGLAIAAVAIIVFLTVPSPVTTLLVTINVGFCIIEILGFMYILGIVIDSVSVINITLAVGLSVDYSAHVAHCFMTKAGMSNDQRAIEALADIGAAVLNGALSTFLAVAVLLFSSSYVFEVLSQQFAITVALGILHGLVLLPVMLALIGPKPFSSAKDDTPSSSKGITATGHASAGPDSNSSDNERSY